MARTNSTGWLAGRVALAAATLVAGGAFIASTSNFTPTMAWADDTAQEQGQAGGTVSAQVSGQYWLGSTQNVVDSMQAARGEEAPLEETTALDAQAQHRAAQYAQANIHSAQNADELVAYLPAAEVTDPANPASDVERMTTSWFTDGSALLDTANGYYGIALFQTQDGDLYLVAVFSSEAGNLSEAGAYVQAGEGTGPQADGTDVPVPVTVNVSLDSTQLTASVTAASGDEAQDAAATYPVGTQLALSYTASDAAGTVTLPGATFVSSDEGVVHVEGATATAVAAGSANVDLYADGVWLASTTLTVTDDEPQPGDDEPVEDGGEVVPGDPEQEPEQDPEQDPEQPEVVQYTISFDANGGEGAMDALTVGPEDNTEAPECGFTAPEGKEFDSWNTEADGTGFTFRPGDATGLPTGDVTLYAQWKDAPAASHTVSFDANGGSGTMDPVTVNAEDEYLMPECGFTAPEGKQFAGWSWDDEAGTHTVAPGESYGLLAGDITFTAQWEDAPAASHTVSFDANGGTGTMDPVTVNADDEYIMPECGFTAPEGKVFAGWSWDDEAGTHTLMPGESYGLLAGDITFSAQWKDAEHRHVQQVTLTFDANGGTGTMDVITADLGTTVTLGAATFTRDGYNFAGWNTAADGTGSAFVNGAQITLGSNVTLYAQWTTSKYITGVQNNLTATTVAGTKPTLPATASIRWSDNSTSNETVSWSEPANYAELYSKAGTFEVTGTVQGHTVKCTVTVTAAENQQQNGIAKTGDDTDYTPIAIAAGVGVVVVILAVVLILKSRKK